MGVSLRERGPRTSFPPCGLCVLCTSATESPQRSSSNDDVILKILDSPPARNDTEKFLRSEFEQVREVLRRVEEDRQGTVIRMGKERRVEESRVEVCDHSYLD